LKLKTQKLALSALIGLVFAIFVITVSLYIIKWQENIFPKQVEFKMNNSALQAEIEPQIKHIIKQADEEKMRRSALLNEISKIILQYKIIHTHSLRLGFDRRLIISADVQKPVLAIHFKNGATLIIGSAMKVINRKPKQSLLNTVPHIFLTDIDIENTNLTNIDFAWLLEQVSLINDSYQWYNANIQKILWDKAVGFVLYFQELEFEQGTHSKFKVYLGHKNLDLKAKKFKTIASILKKKNFNPKEIDLDLLDRAFIK